MRLWNAETRKVCEMSKSQYDTQLKAPLLVELL